MFVLILPEVKIPWLFLGVQSKGICNILPPCVEPGQADWVYLIKYWSFFCFVWPMRHSGKLVEQEKDAHGPNLSLETFRKVIKILQK